MKTYLFIYTEFVRFECSAKSFYDASKKESAFKGNTFFDYERRIYYAVPYKEVYRIQGAEKLRIR